MDIPKHIFDEFNLSGEASLFPTAEERTFRVGDVIVKHVKNDSEEYTNWHADFFNSIKENGFRVPKPIPTRSGKWITNDGWTAWHVLEGNHDFENYIPESIQAIVSFHRAIRDYPRPGFIGSDGPWTRADIGAWRAKPENIHPKLKEDVELLYSLRQPIVDYVDQLIHGDLNPGNILLSDKFPPAIIDIAPYWRPVEFSLAVYAYWVGPWRDHKERLEYFKDIPNFKQMLVRAGIRMLLVMSEFNNLDELEKYHNATQIISEYC
ncbi:MAG TPA: phosphotransferase [Patescibacteria group bacterium]|nr:phosphotransferase [Patescibacteria group bacterium]